MAAILLSGGAVPCTAPLRVLVGLVVLLSLTACMTDAGPPKAAQVLLFAGAGTSPGDVSALEKILSSENLSYSKADSRQMNHLSEADMRVFRLLIVPGGNFEQIGNQLSSSASGNIRSAVHNGLNYLGICAGAFFAGNSPYNGLNLTAGRRFGFYSAEAQGIRKMPVSIVTADGQALDQYWEDGPQLGGWGDAVGKYPDGSPAIVEGAVGNGWVILSGVHPEAPAEWRRGMQFNTPVEVDTAYAAKLIRAALNREPLSHF